MNTKIIFFDIDGTILSHRSGQISDSTKAAIKKAQANGHLAFINTGRTLAEIDSEIIEAGFDGLVCGCGTQIIYHGTELLHTSIPADLAAMLISDLKDQKIEAVLEGRDTIYYNFNSTHPIILKIMKYQQQRNVNIKSWDDKELSFDKFCTWDDILESGVFFYDKYKDMFDLIDRNDRFYEIVPKGHSKATGIQFLINHLDIPHDNTYCFGDSENDLPMLKYVKNSVAMGNASQEIKDLVSYVTKDVDDDGIAHGLRHFGLID